MTKVRTRTPLWLLAGVVHLVAAASALGVLLRRWPVHIAAVVAVSVGCIFTLDGIIRNLEVGAIEHLIYTTRYLLPAVWLWAARL